MDYSLIKEFDKEAYDALNKEIQRQEDNIELIASENYVKPYILEAAGSILTNKYAEGYPEKRYYGGCENIDVIEQIAIDRAKELFHCDHANVQPHSGSNANLAVYSALLKPGDKVLAMNLTEGGHLTHGSKVNFSGKLYDFYQYGVDESGRIDYDDVLKKAREIKPKLIVCGASAYPREIDFKKFREIAKAMEEALREYNFKMVSDGTDNHLLLIDLTNKNINGAQAQDLLDKVNITTNKNTIPNEKLSPQVTSGLRIGTAAITSRGMKEAEAKKIIELIARTIDQKEELEIIKKEVLELTSKFPVYGC